MLATVLITHVKKQRNQMRQKWDKYLQITTSPISKSQKLLPFHRTAFGHFNSYSFQFNSGIRITANLLWTWLRIEFEWIAIEVFDSLRGGKGAVSVILKLDLLWFEVIYLIFGTFDFFVFLTWVMSRTVANINPKIIHFDAVDFSGHHSKEL